MYTLSVILPSHNEPNVKLLANKIKRLIPDAQVIIAPDPNGNGKGWAIRSVLKKVKGKYVAFLDGDGDIEPRMLLRLIPFMEDFDAVVGSKRIVHKHLSRRILTYLSRFYIRLMFGFNVDTQTGIKIFYTTALKPWETDGFLFDVEVLAEMQKSGRKIIEVPIEAEINQRMSWRVICQSLMESVKIKLRMLTR